MNTETHYTILTQQEENEMKQTFDLISDNSGMADINNILNALSLMGYKQSDPQIFEFFQLVASKHSSLTFDNFILFIKDYLTNNQIKENLQALFNILLFEFQNDSTTITAENLLKLFTDMGEEISEEQIKEILQKVCQNGKEITFEDFFNIMANASVP